MAFDNSALLAVSQWLRFFVELNRCSVIKLTPEGGDPFDGSMLMTDDAFKGSGFKGSSPPWRDDHYQGDQPSAIESMCLGSNFLKSGLGQGFRVRGG
jgi:hypothetical protein